MRKEHLILEKAAELFGEKGYQETSIQEIADQLGIAKGSIYSYFSSKEDLLISIYEHYQQLVFERSFIISLDSELPLIERLTKQFQVQFEGMYEYKFYMRMHMRGDGPKNSEKLKSLEHRMRGRFFTFLENVILELFGDEIKPFKWDLFWMVQSIYTSYMRLFVSDQAPIQPKALANHIVKQIKVLGEGYMNGESTPLLKEEHMMHFAVKMDKQGAFVSFEQRELAWKSLYETIDAVQTFSKKKKSELKKCTDRISEEVNRGNPEWLIVKGLLTLLKSEPTLTEKVEKLESVILP